MLREKDKDLFCPSSRICNDHSYEHADDCPVTLLKEVMQTPAGRLLWKVLDLDFATQRGLVPSWDDLPADEYLALRVFEQERAKYEREQMEKSNPNGPTAPRPYHRSR